MLLTGATGFIGSAVRERLLARGHALVCVGRHPPAGDGADFVRLDITQATADDWRMLLGGVDVVINCVGTFAGHGRQTFAAVHVDASVALFDRCVEAGVKSIVQVSALGADEQAASAFHLTKRSADRHLAGLPVASWIVYPSLVFGPGGASATLFARLAALPLLPLPDGGRQALQPVHLDDAADAIVAAAEQPVDGCAAVALVGDAPLTLAAYLGRLRAALGFVRPALRPNIPARLFAPLAALAGRLGLSLASRDSLAMLLRGNTAGSAPVARLLGRRPRPVDAFLTPDEAARTRTLALLSLLLPLLRLSMAAVWLWTAAVSFGLYPVQDSYRLLARLDLHGTFASLLLYGAAALDLAMGVASLALPARLRPPLWVAQIALIAGYTALITWALPEYWLHPFGPVSKNLPLVCGLLLLLFLEPELHRRPTRWTTSP